MKPLNRKGALLLAAFVVMNLGLATGAFAQLEAAKIHVDGLGCPFCVKGIEKHLKKVEGVDRVSTSLKKGEVTLQYAPGAPFDIESLQRAVKRGGFTPGAVQVRARGKIARQEDDFVFNVIGTKTAFLLHQTGPVDGQEKNSAITGETKAKLEAAFAANQTLEITGKVHSHKDAPPALSVDTLKKVSGEVRSP